MRKRKWLCMLLAVIILCTNMDVTAFATEYTGGENKGRKHSFGRK